MTDSSLRLLLEFENQAQRDRSQPPTFLHRRDRKFALMCEEQGVAPDAARWRSWRRIATGFMAVGLIAGMLTMAGLLFYDGGQRINITVFLAFVLLHLVLALFTTVQSLAGWQPWRWLLQRFGVNPGHGEFNRLQPLLMARAAHLGGIAFACAGLITMLAMVVVQDLAFGWSTTLDTAAAIYHENPDPALWGQWWPFVTMLWTTWILIPRLLLWGLALTQTRQKARRLLASHPAMHALMYRLETPALDTGNSHHDADDLPDTSARSDCLPLPDSDILLCWAGAGEPELPEGLRSGKQLVLHAGGTASLSDDDQAMQSIAVHLRARPKPVILLVRSWQPPTGELADFLESARGIWPDGSRVALVPLAPDSSQEPDAHQIQPWLRFAERVGSDFVQVSLPPLQMRDPYSALGEHL